MYKDKRNLIKFLLKNGFYIIEIYYGYIYMKSKIFSLDFSKIIIKKKFDQISIRIY